MAAVSNSPRPRLIVDPPQPGTWNMAVDEALLEAAGEGITTLRFYQWSEPTLSLGYFQAHAARDAHAASRNCPLVRRASGGGAILHDRELTYSFASPIGERFAAQVERLYYTFHETLVATLAQWGIAARLCGAAPRASSAQQPFLCFERRTAGDVLCGDAKIGGSAQRRHQGAVLQHGSVLLAKSPFAPELAGILQYSNRALSASELATQWRQRLEQQMSVVFEPTTLTGVEGDRVRQLQDDRFAAAGWLQRR